MALIYLRKALQQLGVPFSMEDEEKFERYRRLLLEWNEKVNLTAVVDPIQFEIKHFVDSVLISNTPQMKESIHICDMGTGAGFPGIPLAILFPEKRFYLMDSLNKRIRILEQISGELDLVNISLYHGRAEELGRKEEHREKYDLCLSRAVADLSALSEYCLPLVKVGGWFAPYKTLDRNDELKKAERAIELLGGRLEGSTPFELEGIQLNHQILWIRKERNTLPKYPRKAGTPAKNPLK